MNLWLLASYCHIKLREIVHQSEWDKVHALNIPQSLWWDLPVALPVDDAQEHCFSLVPLEQKSTLVPLPVCPRHYLPSDPTLSSQFPFRRKTFSEFQVHSAPYFRVQPRVLPCPWSPRLWLSFHLVPLLMENFSQPCSGRHPPNGQPNHLTHNTPNLNQHFTSLVMVDN